MARAELGYLLLVLLVGTIFALWLFSHRFAEYQRAVRRGDRHTKPVWKPFWIN